MKNIKHIVMLGTDFETKGGISSVVNTYRETGLFQRFSVIYISTHTDGNASKKIRFCITAWLGYMNLLMRGKVALVHVHMSTGMSFWRKLLFLCPTLIAHVPSILHLHGADFREFFEDGGALRKWIIRTVFDKVDSIIVLSNSWKNWAQSVSNNPFIISIYNPVSLPPIIDFSVRDPSSILFLGQLGNRKGSYDLLEAISRIVNKHPQLKLRMAGDGELEQVKAAVDRLALRAHVEILEWVSGPEKSDLLNRAAIYVLPSYSEGLPMSVLEAMAAGLPVICTPVGGVPEAITDGREGCLIVPGDIAALSDALDKLLSRLELRRKMGEAARYKVESTFSTTHIVPQIEQLYERLGVQRSGA
jgi:glycosyltransferase involved in cell wall biosynthesis